MARTRNAGGRRRTRQKPGYEYVDWSAVQQYWAERRARWEGEMMAITTKHLPTFTATTYGDTERILGGMYA